jgi:hypothetical protein
MKTMYDHKSLVVRFRTLNANPRMFFEESSKCDRAERLRFSTSYLPTLQCPQTDRQSGVNENGCGLGLAQSIGLTPSYKLLKAVEPLAASLSGFPRAYREVFRAEGGGALRGIWTMLPL